MRIGVLIVALLAGCATPGPEFREVPSQRISVAGSVFDVRIQGRKGEAIRVNRQYAPRLGPIGARAAFAMQVASGCKVTRITGDAAVVHGTLRCNGEAPPPVVAFPKHVELECYGIDSYVSGATHEEITNYDCDLISSD